MHTTGDDLHCDLVVLAVGVDTTELALLLEIVIPQETSPGVVIRTIPNPACSARYRFSTRRRLMNNTMRSTYVRPTMGQCLTYMLR